MMARRQDVRDDDVAVFRAADDRRPRGGAPSLERDRCTARRRLALSKPEASRVCAPISVSGWSPAGCGAGWGARGGWPAGG
ncbi:hypothetical protein I548_0173 [Mycobacterium intracellulare]|nr:hypothetical protein I548_0173 [Mycobacterium intracellulare]